MKATSRARTLPARAANQAKPARHAGGRPRQLPRSSLGQRLEKLASARGLHLDDLAKRAGISTPTLYRILTGAISSPRFSTIRALAEVLETKLDNLAG